MAANGFQNMLMITAGAKAPAKGMGKASSSGSTGLEGEFAALLASLGASSQLHANPLPKAIQDLLASTSEDLNSGTKPSLNFLDSMGVTAKNSGFTQLGREFNLVVDSLNATAENNITSDQKSLMTLLGIDGTAGRKTRAVMAALAQALSGETAEKPQDLKVDAQGLDALAQLLGAAGFDTEKIEAFITDKKQTLADTSSMAMPFQGLMNSLGEFMKENDPAETWPISTVPHIQTALEQLGIDRKDSERILADVTDKGQGVDMDKLIAALKPYTANSGQTFTTDRTSGAQKAELTVNHEKQGASPTPSTREFPKIDTPSPEQNMIRQAALVSKAASASGLDTPDFQNTLDQAIKGEVTLEQFVTKLKSLADTAEPAAVVQKSMAENFAGVFASSLHTMKRSQTTEGKQSWMTEDTVEPAANGLRFDTKKPVDFMFTEKGEGAFHGNMKSGDAENTWASTPSNGAGTKQPAFEGVMKHVQTADPEGKTFEPAAENPVNLVKTAAKGKNGIAHDSSEPGSAVKSLAGTGLVGRTGDMTQTAPSEKTLPAYVTDQVARQISKAVRNGDSEIRFHIKPPDMGRVELSIATTASGLKISILTEHSATRDMLMNQSTDLRTILADQGIRIEKMDVGLSGNFGQNMAQARHDSDQSGKGRKQKDKPQFTLDPVAEKTRGDTVTARIGAAGYTRGKLDLVA